jgi:TPR repeat protein
MSVRTDRASCTAGSRVRPAVGTLQTPLHQNREASTNAYRSRRRLVDDRKPLTLVLVSVRHSSDYNNAIISERKSTTATSAKDCTKPTGDENDATRYFDEYLLASEKLREARTEQEHTKSQQMYKAWRATSDQKNERASRSQGVAVVRTLVKETHREKETLQRQMVELEERAQSCLEQAAGAGHGPALVILGNQILQNIATEKDLHVDKSRGLIRRAMEQYRTANTAEGWFNLGHLTWTGYPDQTEGDVAENDIVLQADPLTAMESFFQAIEMGDTDAMYFVGVNLLGQDDEAGEGSEKSKKGEMEEGLSWIQKAANHGHGGALYYLAVLDFSGHACLGLPVGTQESFTAKLDQACLADYGEALFLRGSSRLQGEHGYERDASEAFADFLRAVDVDHADAAVSAGAMLHTGNYPGVARNQSRAFQLYQQAGELGSLDGWRNVVACYATGEGVPQSKATAKYIAETMLKDK